MKLLRLLVFFWLLGASGALAAEPTAPDAGSLERDITRTFSTQPSAPKLKLPLPMKKKDGNLSVQVDHFNFVLESKDLMPDDDFAHLFDDMENRPLTLHDLQEVTRRIDAYYRKRGILARTYLPAQEIKDGTVHFIIIHSHLGTLSVEKQGRRADAELVRKMVGRDLASGKPITYPDLERGLLLANDLPGVVATGLLEPGQQTGETQMRLIVDDGPLIDGEVFVNNEGPRTTGTIQAGAGLNFNPGNGSRIGLHVLGSQGLRFAGLDYALPLGADGLRLDLRASALTYELGEEYEELDARGAAETIGAGLRYPLIRSGKANLKLSGNAEYRCYQDERLDMDSRRREVKTLSLGLCGDRTDPSGAGWTQACLKLAGGRLDLDTDSMAADQAGPGTDGTYYKATGQAARLQRLGLGLSLSGRLSGQWASKNLDSSEKFALGGPYGVRAYPLNDAAGDSGLLATLEFSRELGANLTAAIFYDYGRTWRDQDPWEDTSLPNQYDLSGAGIGLSYHYSTTLFLRLSIAQPLEDNPGVSDPDKDQDGSSHGTRAWFTGVVKI
jgi:hemolysin activation/secretion protein